MEISERVFNWLKEAGVVSHTPAQQSGSGNFLLDSEASANLENGLGFTPLIKKLNQKRNQLERLETPMPELHSLKQVTGPAAKLYNWKVLTTALSMLGVEVDPDTRSLIVAGDTSMVQEVLLQILEAESNYSTQSNSNRVSSSSTSLKTDDSRELPTSDSSDGLKIESIKGDTPLPTTQSCLEFLLVSFCKCFQLQPKQAAGLLTQNGKYLGHVIVKGLKGKHEPIINWFQEVFANLKHLVNLIEKEEVNGSVVLVLSSLKAGFLSKSLESALLCCRIFARLGLELLEKDMLPAAWDWFASGGGGIEVCLMACKRFGPKIKSQVVSVFSQFARDHYLELFSLQLRSYIPDPIHYLTTMNEFLGPLVEMKVSREELISAGIAEYWVELGVREADPDSTRPSDIRLASVNFISDLWMKLPSVVESREEYANAILTVLKRGCRDTSRLLKFGCLAKLFHLLDSFTNERNSYAPIIYKTLTFSLLENYENSVEREFILQNFIITFNNISTIPVGILLEPLVKQLQVSSSIQINTIDFDFFMCVARHPRLSVRNAVQTLDILGKIYINELEFSNSTSVPLLMIASRFIEAESVQEYLFRFGRYGFKIVQQMAKQQKLARNSQANQTLLTQRNLMLGVVEKVLKLGNQELNQRLKTEMLKFNKELKSDSQNALVKLLGHFGSPEELIQAFEEEQKSAPKYTKGPPTTSSLGSEILPRRRVQHGIERARQKRSEVQAKKQTEEEEHKQVQEKRKRVLKRQIEKRKIELAEKKEAEEVVVKDLENKEETDLVLKRYLRVLKLLFNKYASTGYKRKAVGKNTFESVQQEKSSLSEGEFYKLLRDQGVTTAMISSEQFRSLLKNYCRQRKKSDVQVHFQEFQEVVVQVAVFVFSKPPIDLSHLPAAVSLKALFEHFKKSENGISAKFYDEPDPGLGDKDVVKKLNLLLQKDPNTPMPEGYKKVLEKEIQVKYNVPDELGIPENQKVPILVLDELLNKALGVHILEPQLVKKDVYRARGVLAKPKLVPYSSQTKSSKFSSETGIRPHKAVYSSIALPTELLLTPGIKYEVARLTGTYSNDLLYECAKLVDDLVYTLDVGSFQLVSRNEKPKVQNKVTQLKEYEEQQKQIQEKKREMRRRMRKQVVEEKLKKAKKEKELRVKQELEAQKQKEAQKEASKKRLLAKRQKEREAKEKQLKEWHAKREQELKQKQKEQTLEQKQLQEEKKKQREHFFKLEQEKLDQQIKAKQESIQNLKAEKALKQQSLQERKQKQAAKVMKKIETQKKLQEEHKKKENEIQTAFNTPQVQQVFQEYSKSIEVIFNHYSKVGASQTKTSNSQNLPAAGFNKFCTQFNLWPGLVTHDETMGVFRNISKRKETGMVAGLDLQEFKEAVLRLGITCKLPLEYESNQSLTSHQAVLSALLGWLRISPDHKATRNTLQALDNTKSVNQRDKKKLKNQIIESKPSKSPQPKSKL